MSNDLIEEELSFHCITCSDEALAMKVVSVDPDSWTAVVQAGNSTQEVDVSLLDFVAEGDVLLVHGGVALENTSC